MSTNTKKLNAFIMLKVPSAWICGVRIKDIDRNQCRVGVKHRWINKNPFKSMYFAVQAMAAELSTGALVMTRIQESGERISMLVKRNESSFSKKAVGRISFDCKDGGKINDAIAATLRSGEGQTFWMESIGTNEENEEVSRFRFEWTIKLRPDRKAA